MLSIGKLSPGKERYYLEKAEAGREADRCGEWAGSAAAELGAAGEVAPEELAAMLRGEDPHAGAGRRRSLTGRAVRVSGFDLTFSPPKSASLTWALGDLHMRTEVRASQARAVGDALAYMEREACLTRAGKGGKRFMVGTGYLGAAYVFYASRAGDPQFHTHVLIANATRGSDGRWRSLYHPAIFHHAKTAGHVHEASFRREMSARLGVEWHERRNGCAEIVGFRAEHVSHFSRRRREILDAAGPRASARALQITTLVTREHWTEERERTDLPSSWQARAAEIGLDEETIARTQGKAPAPRREPHFGEIAMALGRLGPTFSRREVIQKVAELSSGLEAIEIERTADAFLVSGEAVRVSIKPSGSRYTTASIWRLACALALGRAR